MALPDNWRLALAEFSGGGTFDVVPTKVTRDGTQVEVKTIT